MRIAINKRRCWRILASWCWRKWSDEFLIALLSCEESKISVLISFSVTLEYEKHIRKTIQLGQAFQVECKVSYSTSYCHVKAPNGTIYPTNNRYKTHLGECSLEILESVTSDNGTWICSFAQETGRPDEEIYFEASQNCESFVF